MDQTYHPKDDVHRLYIKRKEEGRRLISIEECVEDAIAGFQHYVQNNQERLISAAWRSSGEQEVTLTMKQSLTLFLSLLNFFKKNTNNNMARWKILCIRIFVERKALMFPRNGTSTKLYLVQKMGLLKFPGTLTFKWTI